MSKIIPLFKKYMEIENIPENEVNYNIRVVSTIYRSILLPLNKDFNNIDICLFDEFTDQIKLIDKELNGRDGVESILSAMLLLTEFLKINKIIKGGKIAYYRKIFNNKEYYLDKYDSIKGKKDNTKDFIKKLTKNKFSTLIARVVEDINVSEFSTIKNIINILDSEKIEDSGILIRVLENLNLIEKRGRRLIVGKKGRAFLRLEMEEKYSAIVYSFLYEVNWREVVESESIYVYENILLVGSVFSEKRYIEIDRSEKCSSSVLSLLNCSTRLKAFLKDDVNKKVFDLIFVGMGIVKKECLHNKEVYFTSSFGENILKLMYEEKRQLAKEKVKNIESLIKSKDIDTLEKELVRFLMIFGENTSILCYIGQIYIIKKCYREAYNILIYAYNVSKNVRLSKKILAHIITCCKKLSFHKEESIYEKKYNLIREKAN